MNVRLDPKQEQRLKEIAESSGRTVAEVLEDIIKQGLEKTSLPKHKFSIEEQHANLMRLLDKMRDLPIENPDDGFSGADHDKVLYQPPS